MVGERWALAGGGAGLGPNLAVNTTVDLNFGRGKQVRVYNGQPDPSDPSHFTIGYKVDGQRGTIDGRLADHDKPDWNRVTLNFRDGPSVPFNEPE